MSDVLGMLAFFGCVLAILHAVLRHRYRMRLLATAQPALHQAASAPGHGLAAADVEARVEALEERLAWLERLVRDGDATLRSRVSPPSSRPSGTGDIDHAPSRLTRHVAY
jgi:hypothetical protein